MIMYTITCGAVIKPCPLSLSISAYTIQTNTRFTAHRILISIESITCWICSAASTEKAVVTGRDIFLSLRPTGDGVDGIVLQRAHLRASIPNHRVVATCTTTW
ncbi:hypothetical protein BDQ17DRAFT_203150 [Cyathus striatus]|nr:hypothetical protein BDQ17DRAFT_203150 [Cyathus striatus]